MRVAAAEGAGLGMGGLITILPDLSILAGITLRTVQKLSLLYGFEYNTDEETAELWIAAASAAGVDISRELLEKGVVKRFIPRVIQRIAVQASGEVVEKWSGRLIPIASSLIGAGLNYYFVRAWGEGVVSNAHHIKIDREGNVWLADVAWHIVRKCTPEGKVLGRLNTGERTANCKFGDDGKTLFICADIAVLTTTTAVANQGAAGLAITAHSNTRSNTTTFSNLVIQ